MARDRRAYYLANRDREIARVRAWYQANKEDRRAYARAYYQANRDKRAAQAAAYKQANRDFYAAYNRAYRATHKDRKRDLEHARLYGLAHGTYTRMFAAQGGRCAICRKNKPLDIDHCHKTGVVRGLLCVACNTSLGKLGDDAPGLRRALAYVEGTLNLDGTDPDVLHHQGGGDIQRGQ